jgi:hypothetical protein
MCQLFLILLSLDWSQFFVTGDDGATLQPTIIAKQNECYAGSKEKVGVSAMH